MRGYLSTAFGCPYEGEVPLTMSSIALSGCSTSASYEVAVSDTIGVAHPGQVWELWPRSTRVPLSRVALHFHDTRGTALANVLSGLQAASRPLKRRRAGSAGALRSRRRGNLATEDLVYMLEGLDITTSVRLADVVKASAVIEPCLGHPLASRYTQALSRSRSMQ